MAELSSEDRKDIEIIRKALKRLSNNKVTIVLGSNPHGFLSFLKGVQPREDDEIESELMHPDCVKISRHDGIQFDSYSF